MLRNPNRAFFSLIKVFTVFSPKGGTNQTKSILIYEKGLVSGSFDFLRWSEESITSFDVRNPLGIDQILRVPGRYFFKSNCLSLWPIIMKIIDNNIIYFACLGFFLKKCFLCFLKVYTVFSPKGGTNQTKYILLKQINSTECPYNSKYSCFLSLFKKVFTVFSPKGGTNQTKWKSLVVFNCFKLV